MRNIIGALMVSSMVVLSACGGRTPDPVMVSRQGDVKKSCEVLTYDIQNIEFEIHKLLPQTDKLQNNVVMGVAGFFYVIPWLLVDLKNAEAKEYEALRLRYDRLTNIALDKGCEIEPKNYPSLKEAKEADRAKKAAETKEKAAAVQQEEMGTIPTGNE